MDVAETAAAGAAIPAQATSAQAGRAASEFHHEDFVETAMVRPYMLTGGRTKASYALEMETLISAKDGARIYEAPGDIEKRTIVEACPSPRSVAEIAVNLRMPLGVARVLVSDAADAGLVHVHKTITGDDGAEAHLLLMERVLSGLRRL